MMLSNDYIVEETDESIDWIEGAEANLPVEWISVENEAPLRKVEIEDVEMVIAYAGHSFYVDDTFICKDLTNDKLMGSEKIFHAMRSDQARSNPIIFGAVGQSEIVNVHIVPKSTITNAETISIKNNKDNSTICSLTLKDDFIAEANKVTTFSPVDERYNLIAENESVSLKTSALLPDCVIIIEWDIA